MATERRIRITAGKASAEAILFGRTPASTDDRPRAASAVNIIGRIQGDAAAFKSVASGTRVRLEQA